MPRTLVLKASVTAKELELWFMPSDAPLSTTEKLLYFRPKCSLLSIILLCSCVINLSWEWMCVCSVVMRINQSDDFTFDYFIIKAIKTEPCPYVYIWSGVTVMSEGGRGTGDDYVLCFFSCIILYLRDFEAAEWGGRWISKICTVLQWRMSAIGQSDTMIYLI